MLTKALEIPISVKPSADSRGWTDQPSVTRSNPHVNKFGVVSSDQAHAQTMRAWPWRDDLQKTKKIANSHAIIFKGQQPLNSAKKLSQQFSTSFLKIDKAFPAQSLKILQKSLVSTFTFSPFFDDFWPFLCSKDNAESTWKPLIYRSKKVNFKSQHWLECTIKVKNHRSIGKKNNWNAQYN